MFLPRTDGSSTLNKIRINHISNDDKLRFTFINIDWFGDLFIRVEDSNNSNNNVCTRNIHKLNVSFTITRDNMHIA